MFTHYTVIKKCVKDVTLIQNCVTLPSPFGIILL